MGIFEGVAATVIGTLILYYIFGIGGDSKVTVIHGSRSGRGWRRTIITGWVLVFVAVIVGLHNAPYGGWNNPYVGLAFCLVIIGLILVGIGKLGYAWFRE